MSDRYGCIVAMRNHSHRRPKRATRREALGRAPEPLCIGGCGSTVFSASGNLSYCGCCFYVESTLKRERCHSLSELEQRDSPPRLNRDRVLWRIADVLRRAGAPDADDLSAAIERLTR